MSFAAASHARTRQPEGARTWKERSARFFEELRGPCSGMVRRAYGSALSDEEIEDVYANAWMGTLRALESRQAAMDDEEIRRYVFTAVAHQAGKELRRRRRKPIAPLERAASMADGSITLDERAGQREQSRITRDLLSSLPRRRRAVLLLRYGWGLEPAQVCELIDGLSPRAYRKEITRGVDELIERMKKVEAGDWCDDREPILKAFAAGLADAEQKRQAEHHLAHCRSCSEFVGRLNGQLHDLGGAVLVPGALDLAADGHVDAPDRLADLAERARDSVSGLISRTGPVPSEAGVAGLPASAPRGAGAAGAGLLAQLAGVGAAGKAALACIGGGAVASVCVVAAVGPLGGGGDDPGRPGAGLRDEPSRVKPFRDVQPGPPADEPADPPSTGPVDGPPGNPPPPPPEPEPVPAEPPPAPPPVQQFGLAPAAPAPLGGGSGSSGGRAEASAQEFGP